MLSTDVPGALWLVPLGVPAFLVFSLVSYKKHRGKKKKKNLPFVYRWIGIWIIEHWNHSSPGLYKAITVTPRIRLLLKCYCKILYLTVQCPLRVTAQKAWFQPITARTWTQHGNSSCFVFISFCNMLCFIFPTFGARKVASVISNFCKKIWWWRPKNNKNTFTLRGLSL